MRVQVKADVCQGHAMCMLACPDIFQLSDEDGHAYVVDSLVPAEFEYHVEQAERSCPERAIILS